MKLAATNLNPMRYNRNVVVALRNHRGYWFSFIKRTTGQQEEII